ncbi:MULTISPECIES: hypothetical protein [Planktothrix]|uniref:Uncharacterized protein n=2 Tax=Planktothrix TaxID=54304 RepID=A0A6J7ZPR5_PLARU|nr:MULTISPECIES: hypothetical protein [Planktothrix]CAC5344875.1 conserved hypothetical protein [Planktothrix rubescens NIVA-CYA 18]CAD5967774.1 hypothetical protein PCC7821_03576 [Planktothrix rubescens NIVA-CYA 18]
MAGSINRVDQDIAALEEAIAKIAQEFHHAYEVYLVALGQGVRQQLILASYHLCTQIYPQVFLELSVSQRQKLQQGLRNLARQMQTDLCESLQAPADFELEDLDDDFTSEPEEEQPEENLQVSQTPKPLTPERLFSWQDGIETGIVRLLKLLSKDTNLQLQRFGLLPKKLPQAILEVASKADASSDMVAGPANLLQIMIETEDDDEPQTSIMTRLTAIHLRLGEIEFADANVMARRHQLRHLSGQFTNIRREYQKKLRERAILQAESAWRSIWYED